MIAKRVAARKDGKSSFRQLAQYIADQANSGEKVLYQTASNCIADDLELAMYEIEATQALNQRAKSDKTYHLVLSFQEDEQPTKEQLADIEAEVCKFIGLDGHQRISAVHSDTDNLHVHIAINQIHPESLKMVEPYYDHYRLAEACAAMELRHGLKVDNHALPGQSADRKAVPVDEMRAGGQVPLADWLRDRVSLEGVKSWQQFHQGLAEIGVQVKPKGRGFVFVDSQSGIAVKASAISRELSAGKLVSFLGEYQEPGQKALKTAPREVYTPSPGVIDGKAARAALWTEFNAERQARQDSKKGELTELWKMQKQQLAQVKAQYSNRRDQLKSGDLVKMRKNKRAFYSLLKVERVREEGLVKVAFGEKRQEVIERHQQPDWRDWLKAKADQGNEHALEALRNTREKPGKPKGNQFEGKEDHTLYTAYQYHIHRDGKVTYQFGGDGFTDNGKRIALGKEPSDKAIEAALKMAVQKYGSSLKMGGDDKFKARVARIAQRMKLNIIDDSPTKPPYSPILDYVNERNSKREKVYDILQHRELKKEHFGNFELAGLRNISGARAVLLKRDNEIFVKEVTEAQYMKLKGIKRGDSVNVDNQGRFVKNTIKKGRT